MSEPGQLDEISQAIGRLTGVIEGIEKYIHGERHAVNNLSQKIDGLSVSIGKDIAAVEARIKVEMRALDARVGELELARSERRGAESIILAILKSPAIGWLVGAIVSAWAVLTGRVHL